MRHTASLPPEQFTLECLQSAQTCRKACLQALPYSLLMGGDYVRCTHLRLLLDTAEICHALEDFLGRRSDFSASLCRTACEICERFAESCGHMHEDLQMQECATAARECADACRNLAEES